MDVHQNAKTYPSGRRLMVQRLAEGWTIARVGAAFGVTAKTVRKWQARHARQGEAGLADRTSRPRVSPTRLDDAAVAEILALAPPAPVRTRHRPPARPAGLDREPHPASPRARPARRPRPQAHDRPLPARAARRADPPRHQEAGQDRRYRPSHHRRPPSGARRRLGLPARLRRRRLAPRLHRDPARRAEGERRGLPQAGLGLVRHARRRGRARHDRQRLGLPQPRFRDACETARVKHKRTRPYTPRTNGKAERFIQTSLREWAYRQAFTSSAERAAAMRPWLHAYNRHRPHSALGGKPTLPVLRSGRSGRRRRSRSADG